MHYLLFKFGMDLSCCCLDEEMQLKHNEFIVICTQATCENFAKALLHLSTLCSSREHLLCLWRF